jgi:Zn-dependent peptidase ImmA (M78 family)
MSLRDLEAAIGRQVSAQAIGKYERNEMMPGSQVLLALSKALEVSPEYLLSARAIELTGVDFRKAPHAATTEERAVSARVMDQVERYLQLEELLGLSSETWKAPAGKSFTIASLEAAEDAADELRQHWKIGFDAIPVLTELLEEQGIKVAAVELPASVFGTKAMVRRKDDGDVPVMLVNAVHNGERQRFTLAHELAHLVLHPRRMDERETEKAADRFGGAFLVPRRTLLREVGENRKDITLGELFSLKRLFLVSVATIVVRCYQVGILGIGAYRRLWGEVSALGFLKPPFKEPNPIDPERPRRMERLCYRAVAEGALSESKGAELLGISVRELNRRLDAEEVASVAAG